jgi:hypothetical protein
MMLLLKNLRLLHHGTPGTFRSWAVYHMLFERRDHTKKMLAMTLILHTKPEGLSEVVGYRPSDRRAHAPT